MITVEEILPAVGLAERSRVRTKLRHVGQHLTLRIPPDAIRVPLPHLMQLHALAVTRIGWRQRIRRALPLRVSGVPRVVPSFVLAVVCYAE